MRDSNDEGWSVSIIHLGSGSEGFSW